ncbi:hypothetical protein HRbin17_02315 [bacterium HR17]|uniref:Uncharacterized protein n=1 Tax=Candidatus Fervidibacter japonicus TaxID=2035412 RepID=A0A2H5XF38_9BACT|nr:hypothetical protein HRbin17_02315 [bacterium HR17]
MLNDGVASLFDDDFVTVVHDGACVVVFGGDFRQCRQHIQLPHRPRRLQQFMAALGNFPPQLHEQLILQLPDAFFRTEHLALQLLEFRRDEPLHICQRLLTDVVFRDKMQVCLRDLKVVAENLVVADAQIFDARSLPLFRFQRRNQFLAVASDVTQFVQLRMVAVAEDSAFGHTVGWVVHEGALQPPPQIIRRVQAVMDVL